MRGCFLFVVLLHLTGAAVRAQPEAIEFERATDVEAHLPQSSVYQMLEDQRGFLWFATREGVGRWDGYTMRTWRREPFNTASLPGNVIRQIKEDRAGNIWARAEKTDRTPAGIARIVGPDHETVRRYGHASARIVLGPEGTMWLADSDSLYRFDATRERFQAVRPRIAQTRLATEGGLATRDGTIWICTVDGLEAYPLGPDGRAAMGEPYTVGPDQKWQAPIDPALTPFGALAEDANGTLWVGGVYLARLDPQRRRFLPIPTPNLDIHNYGQGVGIGEIVPVGDALWLATLNGVYRFDIDTHYFEQHSLRLPGDIPTQNWVTGLLRDQSGILWAGTVWGLHRALPHTKPFRLLEHNPDDPNSLGSGLVLSIHEDSRGTLWVGTLGGGLNRIAPDGRITRYRHRADDPATLSHDWIWSLASDDQTLWLGTGGGLDAIDLDRPGPVQRLRFGPNPTSGWGPSATGLHMDAEGTLWFGHLGGLNRLHADRNRDITVVPDDAGIVAVHPAPGGAWVATSYGLMRYDRTEDAFQIYRHDPDDPASLSESAIIALHVSPDGTLWVGTQSGLNRYDPATDGFTHFASADGLPSDVVYAILEDDDGLLWISTNRGLARFDPAAPGAGFRAYTYADGVGNIEFNRNAAFQTPDGTMYFGGDRGVTVFHPDAVLDNPYRPPVVLTALHRSTREGTETTRFFEGPAVIPPEAYTFTFEFAGLSFARPQQNQYAVQMEGWDEDWVHLGTQRQATYTNLPPGRYTFRVRAANEDGIWNENGLAVPVLVQPRIWQTWWFRAFVVLLAVAFVAIAAWSASRRQYRRELARLEARRALEAERARISRDMHDEVGASLTEITFLSELARRELDHAGGDGAPTAPDGLPGANRLARIADTSRATLDAIGEIVWALNPNNDRLPTLVGYLREHTARYLDAAGLAGQLQFPTQSAVPALPVSAEFRRNVFLVTKEALCNAARHAEASTVTVALSLAEGMLTVAVSDDGRGLDHAIPSGDGAPSVAPEGGTRFRGGNGLRNMRQRAEEIGGSLTIAPCPDGGTCVTLAVPLPVAVGADA